MNKNKASAAHPNVNDDKRSPEDSNKRIKTHHNTNQETELPRYGHQNVQNLSSSIPTQLPTLTSSEGVKKDVQKQNKDHHQQPEISMSDYQRQKIEPTLPSALEGHNSSSLMPTALPTLASLSGTAQQMFVNDDFELGEKESDLLEQQAKELAAFARVQEGKK